MVRYRLFVAMFLIIAIMPGIARADVLQNDVNGDGQRDIADAIYIYQYLFAGGPPPPGGDIWIMDTNGDGSIDIVDGLYILICIFG